jgi:hypothetical protein
MEIGGEGMRRLALPAVLVVLLLGLTHTSAQAHCGSQYKASACDYSHMMVWARSYVWAQCKKWDNPVNVSGCIQTSNASTKYPTRQVHNYEHSRWYSGWYRYYIRTQYSCKAVFVAMDFAVSKHSMVAYRKGTATRDDGTCERKPY